MMKCLVLVTVLIISVKSAPYLMPLTGQNMQINQLDQTMMNQIAQQSMEQWIMQNQYNSMQQELMALQQLQAMKKPLQNPMPTLYDPSLQPLIFLMPNTIAKTTNRLENPNDNDSPNLKLGIGDEDTVVINAENLSNIPEMNMGPRRAVVKLPNGQRLIIGAIISYIPFLPFEVNVPDTIGWIYNGISGIIGGIGQRLPFRPKPTTESPVQQNQEPTPQEPMAPIQGIMVPQEAGMPAQENRLTFMQKLLSRRQNAGMPIIMLPMAQTMPIQVPIQV